MSRIEIEIDGDKYWYEKHVDQAVIRFRNREVYYNNHFKTKTMDDQSLAKAVNDRDETSLESILYKDQSIMDSVSVLHDRLEKCLHKMGRFQPDNADKKTEAVAEPAGILDQIMLVQTQAKMTLEKMSEQISRLERIA